MAEHKKIPQSEIPRAESPRAESPRAETPRADDRVPYRLFRDNDRYSEPVFVGVNGRTFLIPRGQTVLIPRCVAQVLDDSEALKNEAAARSDQLESEFLRQSAARSIPAAT